MWCCDCTVRCMSSSLDGPIDVRTYCKLCSWRTSVCLGDDDDCDGLVLSVEWRWPACDFDPYVDVDGLLCNGDCHDGSRRLIRNVALVTLFFPFSFLYTN
eukprot:PhF_6_TR40218/c2_g2_i6/m.59749